MRTVESRQTKRSEIIGLDLMRAPNDNYPDCQTDSKRQLKPSHGKHLSFCDGSWRWRCDQAKAVRPAGVRRWRWQSVCTARCLRRQAAAPKRLYVAASRLHGRNAIGSVYTLRADCRRCGSCPTRKSKENVRKKRKTKPIVGLFRRVLYTREVQIANERQKQQKQAGRQNKFFLTSDISHAVDSAWKGNGQQMKGSSSSSSPA